MRHVKTAEVTVQLAKAMQKIKMGNSIKVAHLHT